MDLPRLIQRHPVESLIAGVAVISCVWSFPNMVENATSMGMLGKQIRANNTEQQRLEANQESFKQREPIAIDRYNNGCLPIQMRTQNKLIGLAEGMRVVDNTTGMPLPKGACVVDYQGGTALIGEDGMALDYAFTGNREVISRALKRSGIKLVPGSPDYGSSNRTFQK